MCSMTVENRFNPHTHLYKLRSLPIHLPWWRKNNYSGQFFSTTAMSSSDIPWIMCLTLSQESTVSSFCFPWQFLCSGTKNFVFLSNLKAAQVNYFLSLSFLGKEMLWTCINSLMTSGHSWLWICVTVEPVRVSIHPHFWQLSWPRLALLHPPRLIPLSTLAFPCLCMEHRKGKPVYVQATFSL